MQKSKVISSRVTIILSLAGAFLFSGAVNLLALASPVFMIEIYDRVIPGRSISTLLAFLAIVAMAFAISAALDILRGRMMARVAAAVDRSLAARMFPVMLRASLRGWSAGSSLEPAQDLEQIRAFLAGPGPLAFFDLPWIPIYLVACCLIHPMIGLLAAAAMVLLAAFTLLADFKTRHLARSGSLALSETNRFAEAASRNSEVIAALGMLDTSWQRWRKDHEAYVTAHGKISDIAGIYAGLSKLSRTMVQSGSLALGAYLVIRGELSSGMILAANIIVGRTLAPVEQLIANWRNLLMAKQSWRRLNTIMALLPPETAMASVPAPTSLLTVEAVSICPPGRLNAVVTEVSFQAKAGSVTGIIGPSASGKTSLLRCLVGVWSPQHGTVRLDGVALGQCCSAELGPHIGYMPQSSELLPGTIADNISRLIADGDDRAVVEAAQMAGAHELIMGLAEGYNTRVGEGGLNLSAGQRQRIALARALYRNPFLVVLDEPNSNLDLDGERALAQAILRVKRRGGIVIIVAHRTSVLSIVDFLLVMDAGRAKAFGPRDAVLGSLSPLRSRPPAPGRVLTVVGGEATR